MLPGPVAVVLPDDLILGPKGCLGEMIAAYEACGSGHLVATMQVTREDVSNYGVLSVLDQDGAFIKADGMVEKPAPDKAPSLHAVVGRYVLDQGIFDALQHQAPGAGGEIQLTDAIAAGLQDIGLSGYQFSGKRFDCGSKQGMLAAVLHLAQADPAFDDVLSAFFARMDAPNAA